MRAILRIIVLVPLAVVLIAFAVANRRAVTVSFDPFASDVSAFDMTGPLFFVLILCLALGVLVGGVATWFTQGRHRRGARLLQTEVEALRDENARLRGTPREAAPVSGPYLPGRAA